MHRHRNESGVLRIVILSQTKIFRDGLAATMAHRPDIEVVEQLDTDVVAALLDIGMPGALDIPKELQHQVPGIKVIAIAVNEADHDLLKCAEAGICGYVSNESSLDDLVAAIHSAVRGEGMCSPRVIAMLFERVASLSESKQEAPRSASLSRREREIVELLELDLSNKAIARKLQISAATVKNHVHNILDKLQVRCRAEAVDWLRNDTALRANRSFFRRRTTDFMSKRTVDA